MQGQPRGSLSVAICHKKSKNAYYITASYNFISTRDIILYDCKYNRSEVFVWAMTEINLTEGTAIIRQGIAP